LLTFLLNGLIAGVATVLGWLVAILPSSPFQAVSYTAISNEFLGFAAWFLPVTQIIAILQAWLLAIGLWYLWKTLMRWVKMIQ
jgi:amino acid permease